jgi:hypothetical protein
MKMSRSTDGTRIVMPAPLAPRDHRPARRWAAAVIALVIAIMAAAIPLGAASAAPARVVSPQVYLADVQAAAGALTRYGTALQRVDGIAELRRIRPALDRHVNTFDRRIKRLRGYRLENARLDRQRAGLARTGPPVADVLRRFNAAAARGDVAAIQRLVPVVQRRITAFQRAATA